LIKPRLPLNVTISHKLPLPVSLIRPSSPAPIHLYIKADMATSAVATAVGSSMPQINLPPQPGKTTDRPRGSEEGEEEGMVSEVRREKGDCSDLPLLSVWVKVPAPVAVMVACRVSHRGEE